VVKILYSENYNGKYNSDFSHYVKTDFSKYNPGPGETGYFYNADTFRNKNVSISEFDKSISYVINSDGFRCDEFGIDTSSNFLFAGCSVSFGMGLPYESTWAYKLNKSLGKNRFYNVSTSGLSIYNIVNNIISYIKNEGNPEHIFVMFPEYIRVPRFEKLEKDYYLVTNYLYPELGLEHTMFAKHLSINSITTLELLCSKLGIGLTWTTWDAGFSDELANGPISKNFNNFLNTIDNLVGGFRKNEKDYPYWDWARDKNHFGEQNHDMFYKAIENDYKKNN
jgi:hypothetical protein